MFKIDKSPAYWWPVTVHTARAGDQPGVETQEFEVEFKRLTEHELDEAGKQLAAAGSGNVGFCKLVMRSFRKVEEDGASLAPTPENLDRLLQIAGVAGAVAAAFMESRRPAAEKN